MVTEKDMVTPVTKSGQKNVHLIQKSELTGTPNPDSEITSF
jgi:hypothetical protein